MFKSWLSAFIHLIYPHNCEGCGTDILNDNSYLCTKCLYQLPQTGFIANANNPVEKKLYGRIKVEQAGAGFYFTKDGLLQHLVGQLKYKNNKEMGLYLGRLIGHQLKATLRFDEVEALIPLPLNEKKLSKRGYNQAEIICEGIASVWNKPIITDAVIRLIDTATQTNKSLTDRWDNIEGAFAIADASKIEGKHVALIDDILTTGASIESCGHELLKVKGVKLSVISVGYTT